MSFHFPVSISLWVSIFQFQYHYEFPMSSFNITMSFKFLFSISLGKHRHPSHWELFLGSGFFFEDFTEKNIVAILITIISSPGMSPGEELWGHFNAINDQQQVFYDDEECHLQIKKIRTYPPNSGPFTSGRQEGTMQWERWSLISFFTWFLSLTFPGAIRKSETALSEGVGGGRR